MGETRCCGGQKFLPFCAGIACGILISFLLFLSLASPAIFNKLVEKTLSPLFSQEHKLLSAQATDTRSLSIESLILIEDPSDLTGAKKMERLQGLLPNDVVEELEVVEDPDWEAKLSPVHIPGMLQQELKLKRKVFVVLYSPYLDHSEILDTSLRTWAKDLLVDDGNKGSDDLMLYVPLNSEIEKSTELSVSYLSEIGKDNRLTSGSMYQMISDMCSQHVDTHHHFFFVNSKSYVNIPKLLDIAHHLDDSETLLFGKSVPTQNFEKFYVNDPDTHCAMNSGLLMSRHLLQRICPRLTVCIREHNSAMYSADLHLARCLKRFLNVTCADMDGIELLDSYENLKDPYSDDKPYANSMAIHPISDTVTMRRMHRYFLEKKLNDTMEKSDHYHRVIQSIDKVLVGIDGTVDDRLLLGWKQHKNKYNHSDVVAWDLFKVNDGGSYDAVYSLEKSFPERKMTQRDNNLLQKLKQTVTDHLETSDLVCTDTSSPCRFGDIFMRNVPGVGNQFIVDVKKGESKYGSVLIEQLYNKMATVKTQVASNTKVNFILPVRDGSPHFRSFMQMLEQSCMSTHNSKNVALLLALTSPSGNIDEKTSDTLKTLQTYKQKYKHLSLRWIDSGTKLFSFFQSLMLAVSALPHDTLICSANVFMEISPDFLHHAQLNTEMREQLYFPVSYQSFDGSEMGDEGFWRSYDYDVFCGYQQDIMHAGGSSVFDGRDLYEKAILSGFDVFRAPDKSLLLSWFDEADCSNSLLTPDEQRRCAQLSKATHMLASNT